MNEREALKLALETLEAAMSVDKSYNVRNIKAIIAIKEALAQPERKWVGLTDEEKSDLWCKSTGQNCVNEDTHPSAQIMNLVIRQQGFNFAKAIEAKLREKNGC